MSSGERHGRQLSLTARIAIIALIACAYEVGYRQGATSASFTSEPIGLPGQVCPAPKTNTVYLNVIKDCHFSGEQCEFVAADWYTRQVGHLKNRHTSTLAAR